MKNIIKTAFKVWQSSKQSERHVHTKYPFRLRSSHSISTNKTFSSWVCSSFSRWNTWRKMSCNQSQWIVWRWPTNWTSHLATIFLNNLSYHFISGQMINCKIHKMKEELFVPFYRSTNTLGEACLHIKLSTKPLFSLYYFTQRGFFFSCCVSSVVVFHIELFRLEPLWTHEL